MEIEARQWMDGARVLPNQDGLVRGGELGFREWQVNLDQWWVDGDFETEQVVDEVYLQCPASVEADRYRFQFRFDGFRDLEMDGSYVDELLLVRTGTCNDWVPFLEMQAAVREDYPEVVFGGIEIDVFLVRGWGGICESRTLGMHRGDLIVLNIPLIAAWTGGFHFDTHHYVLAHEIGHSLGLGEVPGDPGNLMSGEADNLGPELTDGQCAAMRHGSL